MQPAKRSLRLIFCPLSGLFFALAGLGLGGCLVRTAVKTVGSVTVTTVKTAGSVAETTVETGGSVAISAVKVGAGVASAGLHTAASLATSGAVTVLDLQTGSVWRIPWTHGIAMNAAVSVARKSAAGLGARVVRKSVETQVSSDRWARTYLEDGDVVVIEASPK